MGSTLSSLLNFRGGQGEQNKQLHFKVIDFNNEGEVKWGPEVVQGKGWEDWRIVKLEKKVYLQVPPSDKKNFVGNWPEELECKRSSLEWSQTTADHHSIDVKDIQLKLLDACKEETFKDHKRKECDIEIIAGDNNKNKLSWRKGFKPKGVFCATL